MSQELLLLHRNEYYYPHSPEVCHLLESATPAQQISSYASRKTLEDFVSVVASTLAVDPQLVTLYHGAEDALFKMFSWAAGQRMSIYTTSWGWAEYMRMMQGLELNVHQTPLIRLEDEFKHPSQGFREALQKADSQALVLLATPNNPTGHFVSQSELIGLAKDFPQHVFLLDLVYARFGRETFATLASLKNVITLGSFSKYFGMPGLRCGFAIGRVPSVQSMALGPAPWALQLCLAALNSSDHYEKNWMDMQNTAARLKANQSACGTFIRTSAPFVLFRCHEDIHEVDIKNAQTQAQVLGKTLTAQNELYIRWSLGSPEAETRILESLKILERNYY